jgi:hypothetical protein
MNHENKNLLLDLFYKEKSGNELKEIREHTDSCSSCTEYLDSIKETMTKLDMIEIEEPPSHIFANILSEVSESVPKTVSIKPAVQITAILQIVFGEMFLFAMIYFLKIQITRMPFWSSIQNNWFVTALGSSGIAVLVVLIAGAFLTFSIAPILLFESDRERSFR